MKLPAALSVQQCCWVYNLREGTFITVAYTGILGMICMCMNAVTVLTLHHHDGILIAACVLTLAYLAWIITIPWTLRALFKKKRKYLLPWIIVTCAIVVLNALSFFLCIAQMSVVFSNPLQIANFALSIIMFASAIYALLCVVTFYQMDMQPVAATVNTRETEREPSITYSEMTDMSDTPLTSTAV